MARAYLDVALCGAFTRRDGVPNDDVIAPDRQEHLGGLHTNISRPLYMFARNEAAHKGLGRVLVVPLAIAILLKAACVISYSGTRTTTTAEHEAATYRTRHEHWDQAGQRRSLCTA